MSFASPSSARRRVGSIMTLLVGASLAVPVTASAGEGVPSTYDHGAYTQQHFSTKAACDVDRMNAVDHVNAFNVANVNPGACHLIDAGSGATRQVGYIYDFSYTAERPLFDGDIRLGEYTTSIQANAHSFKMTGSASDQGASQAEFDVAMANLSKFGVKVTWNSGVVLNAVTNTYDFEIDYDARKPMYWSHVEISQSPGVTSPSLGVVSPIPTAPPTDTGGDSTAPPPDTTTPSSQGLGLDLSSHTTVNDWSGWKSAGYSFVIMKASESTNYVSPKYADQLAGAKANGLYHGTYHFARPSQATGADQADYFLANSPDIDTKDSKFINRWLDIEDNPSSTGGMCYGMTQSQMSKWVADFKKEIKAKTGQTPGVYTRSGWWNACVGSSPEHSDMPLWLASWSASPGRVPTTWFGIPHLIWQNAANDAKGYDTDVFNGGLSALKAYGASSKL